MKKCTFKISIIIFLFLFATSFLLAEEETLLLKEGQELINKGEIEKALQLAKQKALPQIYLLAAQQLEATGEKSFARALEIYRYIKSFYPTAKKEALMAEGKLLIQMAHYEEAIKALKELCKEKEEFLALKYLGIAYFYSFQSTESLEALLKAFKLKEDAEVAFYIGKIFSEKNLYENAQEYLNKVKELAPKSNWATKANRLLEDINTSATGSIEDLKDPLLTSALKKSTEKDFPQAGAVILARKIDYTVTPQNTIETKTREIIKVLNDRGKIWGEVNINFDSTYEIVNVDFARTITPSGKLVEVGKKAMRILTPWAGFPLYSNVKAMVISMPEVTAGSVLDYQYTVTSTQIVTNNEFSEIFPLSTIDPTIDYEINLRVPKDRSFEYKIISISPKTEKIFEEGEYKVYNWLFEDIPEIIDEPDMPPLTHITPILVFSSWKSWNNFYNWWYKLATPQMEATAEMKEKVNALTASALTPREKAADIFHYLISEVRYVGLEYGEGGYKPHKAEEIFMNKYGDCKDQAVLLATLLKEANIPAYLVLIGTKDYYPFISTMPMCQFNHCIVMCEIDGEKFWLDPTMDTCSFGDIPSGDQGREVLVFYPQGYKIEQTPVVPPQGNKTTSITNMKISPDLSIDVSVKENLLGFSNMSWRYYLKYKKPIERKTLLENLINSISPGAKLLDYKLSPLENLNIPLEIQMNFVAPEYVKKEGTLLLFKIPGIEMDTGSLGQSQRVYPIYYWSTLDMEDKVEITLPEGYKVKFLPEDFKLENKYASYFHHYWQEEGKIMYEREFVRAGLEIPPQDYLSYKKFREAISRELEKLIILEKKNGKL